MQNDSKTIENGPKTIENRQTTIQNGRRYNAARAPTIVRPQPKFPEGLSKQEWENEAKRYAKLFDETGIDPKPVAKMGKRSEMICEIV